MSTPAPASFETWYRAESPRLLGTISLVCGDRDVARDITAEACARALERWHRVGRMASPTGWTYRVAFNLLRRRHRALLREGETAGAVMWGRDRVAASEPAFELWALVATLPPRARAAVALRYLCDLTEAEVAATLGIAEGTASATLTSARRRLAAALSEKEATGG